MRRSLKLAELVELAVQPLDKLDGRRAALLEAGHGFVDRRQLTEDVCQGLADGVSPSSAGVTP